MDELINSKVEIRVDKQIGAMSVKFLGYITFPEFVKALEFEYQLLRNHKLQKCVIDLRLIPVYPNGAPEHVKEVWFPTVSELGMKHIAFVVPEAALGQMSMNKAHQDAQVIAGMSVKHFKDVPSANVWLKTR